MNPVISPTIAPKRVGAGEFISSLVNNLVNLKRPGAASKTVRRRRLVVHKDWDYGASRKGCRRAIILSARFWQLSRSRKTEEMCMLEGSGKHCVKFSYKGCVVFFY